MVRRYVCGVRAASSYQATGLGEQPQHQRLQRAADRA